MTTAVRFQALPPLSPDEYQALEQSIVEHGVMVPIVVDEDDVVIDGHHRQKIALERGLHCPKRTLRNLDDAAKRTMALSLNLDRRHLTREQRRALVAESIKVDPQLSDTVHAKRTGVSDKTVTTVRSELESTSEIPKLDKTIGADGRARPAAQPRPEPVVPEQQLPPLPENYMGQYFSNTEEQANSAALANMSEGQFESAIEAARAEDDLSAPNVIKHGDGHTPPSAPQVGSRKPPITKSFLAANYRLTQAVGSVVRLSEDDRFKKNKDQISGCHLSDLIRARDALNGVIQQLEG